MSSQKKKKVETESNTEDAESMLLLYSGLEDAFIGTVEQYGRPPIACYSKQLTISILEKDFNLSTREAQERYEYEYLQNNFDISTPCFLDDD
tara:strand:- start:2057 stop:2332 length:276 start_codon:yes stop_codon:yes gene_type:complete